MYSTDTCVVVVVASSWQGGELNTKPQPEHPVNESPGRREVQDCDGTRRSAWPTALSFSFLLSRPPGFIAPPWEQEECARARRPPPVVPCTYLSTACRAPRAPHPPPPKKSPAPSGARCGGHARVGARGARERAHLARLALHYRAAAAYRPAPAWRANPKDELARQERPAPEKRASRLTTKEGVRGRSNRHIRAPLRAAVRWRTQPRASSDWTPAAARPCALSGTLEGGAPVPRYVMTVNSLSQRVRSSGES